MTETHGFILHDGRQVSTLAELAQTLSSMDDQTYARYCNSYKNDFATWIRDSLHETQLADILEEARSRESAISVVHTFLKLHEEAESDPFRVEHSEAKAKRFFFHRKQTRSSVPAPAAPDDVEDELDEIMNPPQAQAAQATVQQAPETATQEQAPEEPSVVQNAQQSAPMVQQEDYAPPSQQPTPRPAPQPAAPRAPAQAAQPATADRTAYEAPAPGTEITESGEEILTEEVVKEYSDTLQKMRSEINKVFIGQEEVVEQVLLCLMCDSHSLLEGVPGLAKSLLVETLTHIVDGTTFHRIQFVPDMLPADVLGGQIYNPATQEFKVVKGPIFANFILADEINRAPPKTHAAVMEAMQEKKINIDKEEYPLDPPFLIIATQNPLENKGTYELPEAVLDRFMFKLNLDYPARKDEKIIITENATTKKEEKSVVQQVVTKKRFLHMQQNTRNVYLSERIRDYILDLVEATRGDNKEIEGAQFVKYGAGPRASIYLGIGAKARAIMQGRNYVLPDDVNFVAKPILRHRVALNFKGKAHGIKSDRIVEEILSKVTTL